ncbi:MAG: hypothetical protein ACK56F_19465, partial [bacterium]
RTGAVAAGRANDGAHGEVASGASGDAGEAEHAGAGRVEPGQRGGRVRVDVPASDDRAGGAGGARLNVDVEAVDGVGDDEVAVLPRDDGRVGSARNDGRGSGRGEVLRKTRRQHASLPVRHSGRRTPMYQRTWDRRQGHESVAVRPISG